MERVFSYIWVFVIGACAYSYLQAHVFPVTGSCREAFTRQTVENPAWAKDYWEDVAKRVYANKNTEITAGE